ncbi:hypothetical protein M9R32_12415 [Paenisporosarcina quisquiliarum]|uniref:Uncharacterized protein n=1 Tax=Paenisporosarcina quisquiliarum TaxID=365346 RepID=A0A9X3RDW8_9BACL|nr:hypothetical protein [Paenisporosarcina quisquiliarum]MCZ8537991.1 hypothetical protein [Paenisporosarcina quisquiliarum]
MSNKHENPKVETKFEQPKKHHKIPSIEFADAVNRSMVGDLGALAKGGCMSTISTVVLAIVVIFLLSKCSL